VIPERIVPIPDQPEQTCRGCDWWRPFINADRGFCALYELKGCVTDPACESWRAIPRDIQ
jgi:hypothetical protein